jgi:hypothetical protein
VYACEAWAPTRVVSSGQQGAEENGLKANEVMEGCRKFDNK